ncbi:MAG: hypothetical protein BroJett011_21400 [Chloroflexota bacterium]|nr:MAG: hypothetical protein BroJett011_21400 [Chloroflexota bacterium]
MDALTQLLNQQLSGGGLSQISQQVGADEQTTGNALSAAMPLLLSAMANNASTPQGAQSLHQALAQDHDGAIFNDMAGFLSNPQAANGAGILGHVLGPKQDLVQNGLAQQTGLDAATIGQLLTIAAPLVMGALGKTQQEQGFDADGLSSFLGQQQQAAQQSDPGLMGMLGSLLDMDKDGSALDDILGLAGKLFSGR